jgi:hypothetical protein
MIFIDYKKVFDSVRRDLEKLRISADILRKVKNTYEKTINCVKTNMRRSSWFQTRSRIRQGNIFSPILFNVIMNAVIMANSPVVWGFNTLFL